MKLFRVAAFLTATLIVSASIGLAAPTLKRNSEGQEVLVLQKKLQQIGYSISEADGVYGYETERAVSAFQRDQNIKITGIVTSSTWRALKNTKGKNSVKSKTDRKNNNTKSRTTRETSKSKSTSKSPSTLKPDSFGVTKNGKLVKNNTLFLDKKEAQKIIKTAKNYMGTPYVFGGSTPSGFDCSGFLQFVFEKNGIMIPRLADEQYLLGEKKNKNDLVPGDLVFFTTYASGASHCGIYLGEDKFIHTSSSKGVKVDEISDSYWNPRYLGGKHIVK